MDLSVNIKRKNVKEHIKKYTVLIIDDEKANLDALTSLLESEYYIIQAENGQEALSVIKESDKEIHIIIADQRMPGMKGVEFFRQSIQLLPKAVRILMTGYTDTSEIIDAINEGHIYKFITKPADMQNILQTVRRSAEFWETENENRRLIRELEEKNQYIAESRKLYEQLFLNAPIGILLLDTAGAIHSVNPAALEILGSKSEEDTKKFNCLSFSPLIEAGIADLIENCIESRSLVKSEVFYKSFWGKELYLFCIFSYIKGENEKDWIYAIIKDITERKFIQLQLEELNEELIERTKQAMSANKMKSEFLANMSHEIRTPLNAVTGYSELLSTTLLDDTQKSYLENIQISAKTLLDLLHDVLDLSKIEAGKLDLDLTPSDIRNIAQETVRIIHLTAERKNLTLDLIIPSSMPSPVIADSLRLKQVLLNLLNNAVKFTDSGSVIFSISFDRNSDNDVVFHFSIKDTGIGISPDEKKKLFQAFSQADTSTTRKYGGSGLGLVICSKLIQKMGGELQLISEKGKGSEFYFSVLMHLYHEDEQSSKSNYTVVSFPENIYPVILIADDNKINLALAQKIVMKIFPKAEILEASDGKQAVELFCSNQPDLVILDIQMPVMDGYEACRQMRKSSEKRIPIIALTANAMAEEKNRCLDSGMDHLVIPPFLVTTKNGREGD
ncbi:MAG TPA: response regulator, partial [Leptospiraceae bacterium]|nr:response regulator [Leptospiraceae bacterium]